MGRGSQNTYSAQVGGFFKEMFASVNLGPIRGEPTGGRISIEPEAFSLTDRREVAVTYSVVNNSNKIIRLEYPTTQRLEIVAKGPDGNPVERWSDDRAFEPEEGIVIINPKERIEYQERIPTREMKPGSTYNIEANTTSQNPYTVSKPITPWE
jgi:hypothetical protein